MKIFVAIWYVVSDISKVLLNDIFTELDRISGIKNIITDRLVKSFKSGLQVDDISTKITTKSTKKLYQ